MNKSISTIFYKIKPYHLIKLSKNSFHLGRNTRYEFSKSRKLFSYFKVFNFSNSLNGNANHSNHSNTIENSSNTIDMQTYMKEVDKLLNHIYETLDVMDLEVVDSIVLSDGVLKISFKKNKHFVINIQRPNLQIWLSSPFSGPQRFEFNLKENKWENIRNKKSILLILEEEFNCILKSENSEKNILLQ